MRVYSSGQRLHKDVSERAVPASNKSVLKRYRGLSLLVVSSSFIALTSHFRNGLSSFKSTSNKNVSAYLYQDEH